ncbi:unnamed protein product [Allacma fusca]|uniref:SAND domain-containing protein n=1 Tax=Allacma fusca TaxID=39272 RepID=A0A8J2PN04_9HEXA|nr:unnamed protein product [Allacma fusca]
MESRVEGSKRKRWKGNLHKTDLPQSVAIISEQWKERKEDGLVIVVEADDLDRNMSEQTDDGQMVGTDIPDVTQVESVMCVNQNNQDVLQVTEDQLTKSELVGNVKVEEDDPDSVLGLHHGNVNIHNVSVTTTSSSGIITIPVVGTLSPCQYSVIGDPDTVVTPISVSLNAVNQGQSQHQQSHPLLTWEEAVSAEILPVRCKDTNAELHKSKFGSGNKGKCIKAGNDWYTPTEFEAICGRGNSKDWKRSIRFGGRTLQTLIDKKFLIPHASSCICSNCVDDATATGPIRPFTPYQRKRKGRSGDGPKGGKLERLTSKDSTTDESSDLGTPGTPGMNSGINPLTQALLKISQPTLPPSNDDAWKTMEDAVEKLVSEGVLLKSMLQEMKARTNQEIETLRSQLNESSQSLQQALHQAQQQTQTVTMSRNLEPQILRIFDSNRIQTYSIEVLDPETFKQLQVTQATGTNAPKVSSAETTVLPPISQLF